MKTRIWFILMALALLSCAREMEVQEEDNCPVSAEDKRVTITFSVLGEAYDPATKADEDDEEDENEMGGLKSLYLAVFGNSGYLKEYVPATYKRGKDDYYEYDVVQIINNEEITTHRKGKKYTFSAKLALSDSPRKIHILGNGPKTLPFGYDTAVLPSQLCENGEEAYWQYVYLPNGIKAKKVGNTYVDINNNPIPDGGTGYIPDPNTEAQFHDIPLVRNRARIAVYSAENSNFKPKSFAVVNIPERGTYAPYSGKTGFVLGDDSKNIKGYQNLGHEDLEGMGYPANLPLGHDDFDDSIPEEEWFKNPSLSNGRVAAVDPSLTPGSDTKNAVYLYERPAPSDKMPPTYVIIYGHYRNEENAYDTSRGTCPTCNKVYKEDEGDYYYKVDLMDTKKVGDEWYSYYYPIYRNFKYQINIEEISSKGQDSPAAAAASAGSADVSADVNTSGLSDISDGVGLLHVMPWMAYTFTGEHDKTNPVDELQVLFYKSTTGSPDTNPGSVKVEILDPTDGGDPIIYPVPTDDAENPEEPLIGGPDEKGWRHIRFCTVKPGKTTRSQTIRITGYHDKGRLYRDVEINIQEVQDMWVRCEKTMVSPSAGSSQTVTFGIPDGLTKSMFPLDFTIEAEDLTLTPDNSYPDNNLPVISGYTIASGNGPDKDGQLTFQFRRTVTWDEYRNHLELEEDDNRRLWRIVPCYFKTNCDASATTVWVYNHFFKSKNASDDFHNFEYKEFTDLKFPDCIPWEADKDVRFTFKPAKDSQNHYPKIQVLVRGLVAKSSFLQQIDLGTYIFTPTDEMIDQYGDLELVFITTTDDGDIAVDLSSEEFFPAVLEPFSFTRGKPEHSFGFLEGLKDPYWSNVAYGRIQIMKNGNNSDGRGVTLGYYDDPNCEMPIVNITDRNGKDITTSTDNVSGLKALNDTYKSPFDPNGKKTFTDKTYHEIYLSTVGTGDNEIEVILSSKGYAPARFVAGRLKGQTGHTRLHTMELSASKIYSCYQAAADNQPAMIKPTLVNNDNDQSCFIVQIVPEGTAPAPIVNNTDGLILGKDNSGVKGGRYKLTVYAGNFPDKTLNIGVLDNAAKYQRFFMGRFTIASDKLPVNVEVEKGHGSYFKYPGSDKIYTWEAYDDGEAEYEKSLTHVENPYDNPKTIYISVGTDHEVIISGFFYKAISYY